MYTYVYTPVYVCISTNLKKWLDPRNQQKIEVGVYVYMYVYI
jgi:hypothetical protein